jgi:hypothetical protein
VPVSVTKIQYNIYFRSRYGEPLDTNKLGLRLLVLRERSTEFVKSSIGTHTRVNTNIRHCIKYENITFVQWQAEYSNA